MFLPGSEYRHAQPVDALHAPSVFMQGVVRPLAPLPALAWPVLLLGPVALLAVDEAVKAAGRVRGRRAPPPPGSPLDAWLRP